MPLSRREQLELDELLSDIYRGIEALPDKSSSSAYYSAANKQQHSSSHLFSSPRVHVTSVREYELPASSPLVEQHRRDLANARPIPSSTKQPQRSTLKRNTNTPDYQQHNNAQSLASFVTSTTPDNKRRVRILDHPEKLAVGYSSEEEADTNQATSSRSNNNNTNNKPPRNVKYVNTNKLIYHQERNPDDDPNDSYDENNNYSLNQENTADDIDGVTLIKTYHTTWLDRQLGKASKRRSSKELNERQVKEKAMIEELKRSLKNGVITLKRPFKGKRNTKKETFDDQVLTINDTRRKEPSVVGSGLATISRNYHHQQHNNISSKNRAKEQASVARVPDTTYNNQPQQTYNPNTYSTNKSTHQSTSSYQKNPEMTTGAFINSSTSRKDYSSTLPQNYRATNGQQHQLLHSHYRGADRSNYSTVGKNDQTAYNQHPVTQNHDNSPYATRNILNCRPNQHQTPENNKQQQLQQPYNQKAQPYQQGSTISGLPSPTDVVRTALSRNSSQLSLNQLNKTINYLPESPNPPSALSPTPTQYLKPSSPSLSPSPVPSNMAYSSGNQHQPVNNILNYCTSPRPNSTQSSSIASHNRQQQNQFGTSRDTLQQPMKQPLYSNTHSSILQHKLDQQTRYPGRGNVDSIKEFNELDSLLKSLGPTSNVQITPGYTTRPTPPSFGYGQVLQNQHQAPFNNNINNKSIGQPTGNNNPQQMYATVQKQPTSEPFIVDATINRNENCARSEQLSEFEPRIDLLPSMEDYQNISKLNPVKNSYWYKPNMSRDRAIALLKDKPQGTFIVRDSSSFQGAFGLAVKVSKLPKNVQRNLNADPSSELIRHFLIEPTTNGVRLKGYANEPVFGSLPALIYQHSLTELALPCKLLIPRVDIEDLNFNSKQKQFFDEFAASKELAKHQPYDRTSPNNGYRKYPGDVYVKNEHRIIFQ